MRVPSIGISEPIGCTPAINFLTRTLAWNASNVVFRFTSSVMATDAKTAKNVRFVVSASCMARSDFRYGMLADVAVGLGGMYDDDVAVGLGGVYEDDVAGVSGSGVSTKGGDSWQNVR